MITASTFRSRPEPSQNSRVEDCSTTAGERPGRRRGRIGNPVRALVIGTLLLAAGGCSPTTDNPDPQPSWQLVLEDLPAGLLSISGSSDSDVYAVGIDPGDGGGPLVMHYDGQDWNRLNTGASGDLWWISDRPIDSRRRCVQTSSRASRQAAEAVTFFFLGSGVLTGT